MKHNVAYRKFFFPLQKLFKFSDLIMIAWSEERWEVNAQRRERERTRELEQIQFGQSRLNLFAM